MNNEATTMTAEEQFGSWQEDEVFTREEAAHFLKIHKKTMLKWSRESGLPWKARYMKSELIEFVKNMKH